MEITSVNNELVKYIASIINIILFYNCISLNFFIVNEINI